MIPHVLVGGKTRQRVLEEHLQRQREAERKTYGNFLTHLGLEWCSKIPPKPSPFIESFEHIESAGYSRPPLPRELFSILMDDEEGRAPRAFDDLLHNLRMCDVWLDCMIHYEPGRITIYDHPRKITLLESGQDFEFNNWKERYSYLVEGDVGGTTVLIKDLKAENLTSTPDLITKLWSRPFHQLPPRVQENATLAIPPIGRYLPLYLCNAFEGYNISNQKHEVNRLGVRAIKTEGDAP